MDKSDYNEPIEKHGLEHGYTPPDHKRRKPLRRSEKLSRRDDEMLYVQAGLGAVVLLLLLWFIYHIYQEKQRNHTIKRYGMEQIISPDRRHDQTHPFICPWSGTVET